VSLICILVIVLVVLTFRIHTIVSISLLVRLSKSGVHLNLNSDTPFSVGTLIMLSRNLTVTKCEATPEASSCKLGFAVRRAYKTIVRLYRGDSHCSATASVVTRRELGEVNEGQHKGDLPDS